MCRWSTFFQGAAIIAVLPFLFGCLSGSGPEAVTAPEIDPATAAAQAIELYDSNKDGALSASEATKVPPIDGLFAAYDTDGDKKVSKDEITKRLQDVFQTGGAMSRFSCTIMLGRGPLEGAEVVFEPDPFMGSELKAAVGKTDSQGIATMRVPDKDLPEENQGIGAAYNGLYRVRITHPSRKIHQAYQGDDTVLGCEISSYTIQGTGPVFRLDAKGTKPKQVYPQ